MTDNRKVSIVIPTYNRYEQLIASFEEVREDSRISAIWITDDASSPEIYKKIDIYVCTHSKIRLYRNDVNKDCYFNKKQAMGNAQGDWGILLDSDNKIDKSYLDALYAIPEWDSKTVYMPCHAKPYFSAKEWSGLVITKENVSQYADTNLMTNLNAMNWFINREEYLKIWDGSVNPHTSDSIYFSYCWLAAGNKILVTPNLEYDHYIDHKNKSGHYQTNVHKTGNFHNELIKKFKELK